MGGLVFSSGICNGHFGTLIWTRVRRGNHYLCLNQAVFLKGRNLHRNLVVIMVNPCTFFLLCNWCSIIIIVAGATTIIWRSKLSQLKNKEVISCGSVETVFFLICCPEKTLSTSIMCYDTRQTIFWNGFCSFREPFTLYK